MPRKFVPKVVPTRHIPSSAMLAWAQGHADAAYGRLRLGNDGMETTVTEVCATDRAVPPHRDDDGTLPGMRVVGLVLRSDGHRLHSDNLHDSGCHEGVPLNPGDLYLIDPFDRHWTTVPDGADRPQLIFTVNVMMPDGRTATKLANDMWWTVLAASIDALRGGMAAKG